VDEAILDVVELVEVIHNCLTLILHKMLDKGISADGNPKANVAVNHKARRREQRTEVIKGGIGSEHAQGGSVRVGRRDTLDEKLGLRLLRAVEIEGESSVFLEYVLQVREHLEGDRQLGFDVTIVGICYGARVLVVLGESAAPDVVYGQAEDDHLERIPLLSASLAPGVEHVAEVVKVVQVGLGGAHGPS